MARTRAGLSGRPTCRPGVICPGLSAPQGWPLAAMPAGLPVGTLRPCLTSGVDLPRAASAAFRSLLSGQRPAGVVFLSWPLVFMALVLHCCRFWPGWWCPTARQVPRLKKRMAAGHPFMGRGSRLDRGNPGGVPRPQAALRRFVLRRRSSYPRFGVLQLLVFKYLKKAICSKLLVGAVDNPEKLGVARVCGLWKSRARDRLHVTAGQIARWRGTDCTLRIFRIGRCPLCGGRSGRGTDYTWITPDTHKVFPQAGACSAGGWCRPKRTRSPALSPKVGGAIYRPALVTLARWPGREAVTTQDRFSAAGTA